MRHKHNAQQIINLRAERRAFSRAMVRLGLAILVLWAVCMLVLYISQPVGLALLAILAIALMVAPVFVGFGEDES